MSKDILGIAVRKLVTMPVPVLGIVCDLLEKLADQEWVEALKKFLRKENPWLENVPTLLKFVGNVSLPTISEFDAEAHFKVTPAGERDTADVVIGWVGKNMDGLAKGKVETDVAEATLRVHRLIEASVNASIIAELGNEVAETTLAQIYQLLKAQGHGQQGALLTNGFANVFYVGDWAVCCRWISDCDSWVVCARPFVSPDGWGAGRQVVSR